MRGVVCILTACLWALGGCASTDRAALSRSPLNELRVDAFVTTAQAPPLCDQARAWVESKGGLAEHPKIESLRGLANRLAKAAGLEPVALRVLDNPSPTAFATPPNDIFLTTGLIDVVGEADLAAVISHELGHLAERHHTSIYQSLDGRHSALEEEARADAVGLLILEESGEDPAVMLEVMCKVRDYMGVKDPAWSVLHQRIIILRRTLATMFSEE